MKMGVRQKCQKEAASHRKEEYFNPQQLLERGSTQTDFWSLQASWEL